jgi:hypothetical protein
LDSKHEGAKDGLEYCEAKAHSGTYPALLHSPLYSLCRWCSFSCRVRRRTSNSRRTAPLAANRRGSRDERYFDECWFFKVEIEASQSRRGRGGGKGKEREQKTILPLNTHYKHWQMSKVNTASFQFGARSPA